MKIFIQNRREEKTTKTISCVRPPKVLTAKSIFGSIPERIKHFILVSLIENLFSKAAVIEAPSISNTRSSLGVFFVLCINKFFHEVDWLVYPFSSLGWRYGANGNPGSRHQPN